MKALLLLVPVAMVTLISPSAAIAGDPPAAIAQYVEMIPTASGERPLRPAGKQRIALAPDIRQKLATLAPDEAAQLEELATSPALGASLGVPPKRGAVFEPTFAAAAFGGGGAVLWMLGAALLAITAGLVAVRILTATAPLRHSREPDTAQR